MFRRRGRGQTPSLDALARADGADINELLRDVAEFRLALEVDLTVAAAAADAVEDEAAPAQLPSELAGLALASGRDGVAAIHRRSMARTAGAGRPPTRRRLLTLVPTAPLVLVALALGLGGGAIASHLADAPGASQNTADSSLATLSAAIGQGNRSATMAAAHRLQADVAELINAAAGNPQAGRDAATLLLAEQTVIAQLSGPEGVELRATVAKQSAALERVAGSPLSTLGEIANPASPASRPTTAGSISLPLPLSRSLLPHPEPPSALGSPTPGIHVSLPPPLAAVIPSSLGTSSNAPAPVGPVATAPAGPVATAPADPLPALPAPLVSTATPGTATPGTATPGIGTPAIGTPGIGTPARSGAPAPTTPAPSLGLPTDHVDSGLQLPAQGG